MRMLWLYVLGFLALSLFGVFWPELIPRSFLRSAPMIVAMSPSVLPLILMSSVFVIYLVGFKAVFESIKKIKTSRKFIWGIVYAIGLVALLAFSWVPYYIGAAGYEYGDRSIPYQIYSLWGVIPTILLSSFFTWFVTIGLKGSMGGADD